MKTTALSKETLQIRPFYELTSDQLDRVSGGGDVAAGLTGVGISGSAGFSSGAISGAIWGARVGGFVGAGVGALVGIGYVLATSGGGGRKRSEYVIRSR